jgi:hypothetical protein
MFCIRYLTHKGKIIMRIHITFGLASSRIENTENTRMRLLFVLIGYAHKFSMGKSVGSEGYIISQRSACIHAETGTFTENEFGFIE